MEIIMRIKTTILATLCACFFCCVPAQAATKPVRLVFGKTYQYDLNGDKRTESIRVQKSRINDDRTDVKVYINGSLLLKRMLIDCDLYTDNAEVYLLDLNKKDKYKEIYMHYVDFGGAYGPSVYRYNGNSFQQIAYGYDTNAKRCEFSALSNKQPSNGTIAYTGYLAIEAGNSIPVTYQLKVSSRNLVQKSYTLTVPQQGRYKTTKTVKAMKSRNGKKTAFTMKRGNSVRIIKVYAKPNAKYLYFYVKNAKGKKGWVKSKYGAEFTKIA